MGDVVEEDSVDTALVLFRLRALVRDFPSDEVPVVPVSVLAEILGEVERCRSEDAATECPGTP